MKYFVAILLCMFLSCSSPFGLSIQHKIKKWNESDIVGYRLNVISIIDAESLYFDSSGAVFATIGFKHGAVAAPEFEWIIDNDGVLVLYEYTNGPVHTKLRKFDDDNGIVVVDRETFPIFRIRRYKKEKTTY